MGQTANHIESHQIESHIEDERIRLHSNLRELESRVRSATDWHEQFRSRPMILLGAAFGGGMLVAAITRGSRTRRYRESYRKFGVRKPETLEHAKPKKDSSPVMENASRAWENVKGALIGVAAQKIKEYADGVVPGFSREYDKAQMDARV